MAQGEATTEPETTGSPAIASRGSRLSNSKVIAPFDKVRAPSLSSYSYSGCHSRHLAVYGLLSWPVAGVDEGGGLFGVPTSAAPQTTRRQTGRERPAATVAGYRNHQGIPCACRLFRPSLPLCLRGLPCYGKPSRIRHDRACLHRGAAPIMRARVTPASVNICWGGATGGALLDPIFRCDERTSSPVGSKARLAGLVLPTGSRLPIA